MGRPRAGNPAGNPRGVRDDAVWSYPFVNLPPVHDLPRRLMWWLGFLRISTGISQTELAARIGTTQPAVSKWESRGNIPTIPTLERISRATRVPIGLYAERDGEGALLWLWTPPRDEGTRAIDARLGSTDVRA